MILILEAINFLFSMDFNLVNKTLLPLSLSYVQATIYYNVLFINPRLFVISLLRKTWYLKTQDLSSLSSSPPQLQCYGYST